MKIKKLNLITGLLVLVLATANAFAGAPMLINGAGATFPYPIYSKWFSEYAKVDPSVTFNYQSIGSGGGVKQIIAGTVDFGATDGPMSLDELNQASGPIVHIPMVAGAVTVTYNIPGITTSLNLSSDVIADIFLGKIKNWNDPRIAQDNTGTVLPADEIIVAHRSDGSGTTYIFTDFLSSVSGAWKGKVGTGKAVNWPVGLGGKGNEGVAGIIKQTPGSIGYLELAYAENNKLSYAAVKNKSGKFILPSIESTTQAVLGKVDSMPSDFRVSIVNPDGADAYPISGLTWILVYKKQTDKVKGQKIVEFLKWAVHDGQSYCKDLMYASLPEPIVAKIDAKISEIKY